VAVLNPGREGGTGPLVLLQAPSFVATHDFCKDNMSYLMPLCFQSFEKWENLRFPLSVQKTKMLQLQGDFAPDPLTRGSAPGSRWELYPQTPVIGSRYRTCHGAVLPPDFVG